MDSVYDDICHTIITTLTLNTNQPMMSILTVIITAFSFTRILKVRMLNDKVITLEKGFVSDAHVFGLQQTRCASYIAKCNLNFYLIIPVYTISLITSANLISFLTKSV